MSNEKRIDGELYWPFRCERGHEFDLGPIHDPEASEPDPDSPDGKGEQSVPGSGRPQHVPEETFCRICAPAAFGVPAHRVDD